MKNIFVTFLLTCSLLLVPAVSRAEYVSDNCPGDPKSTTLQCPAENVGPFLKGISNNCGNTGTCTLGDIMIVFANVGNFVLKIIAPILLFMYVLGGFWILASHGSSEWVKKGKETLKISTFGLLIVMVAYIGIQTLYKILTVGK